MSGKPIKTRGGFQRRQISGGEMPAPVAVQQAQSIAPPRATTYDPALAPGDQFKSNGQMALDLENALADLNSGTIQSYTLPTGVTVTKRNLEPLNALYLQYKRMAYVDYYGRASIANLGNPFP